ncbi:MAG: molecular chaperone [Pseudoxanthomonas sp.]
MKRPLHRLIIIVALLMAGAANAASLRISPIGLDIPSDERAASMTLVNTSVEPVNLQLRVFQWSQRDGRDVFAPTTDILVTPPATTIPPGASYTVRVARTGAAQPDSELSYRLFIDELPKPVDPGTVNQGVAMVLRTSLPVFVVDPKAYPKLAWELRQDAEGLHLKATNSGGRHAKISGLALHPQSGDPINFGDGLNGYVLAGSSRVFDLKPLGAKPDLLPAGAAFTLTAKSNGQDIQDSVLVSVDAH